MWNISLNQELKSSTSTQRTQTKRGRDNHSTILKNEQQEKTFSLGCGEQMNLNNSKEGDVPRNIEKKLKTNQTFTNFFQSIRSLKKSWDKDQTSEKQGEPISQLRGGFQAPKR